MSISQFEIRRGSGLLESSSAKKTSNGDYILQALIAVLMSVFIWYEFFFPNPSETLSKWDILFKALVLIAYVVNLGYLIYEYFRSNRDPFAEFPINDLRSVLIDASGLQLDDGNSQTRFGWSELFRVLETPKAFIIHLDADQKIRIDKEKLAIDGNLGTMRTWVEQGSERYLKVL